MLNNQILWFRVRVRHQEGKQGHKSLKEIQTITLRVIQTDHPLQNTKKYFYELLKSASSVTCVKMFSALDLQ